MFDFLNRKPINLFEAIIQNTFVFGFLIVGIAISSFCN